MPAVFGKCNLPLSEETCPILNDASHVKAITTAVVSICQRFEGGKCVCILEKAASAVSCSCGDGILPNPKVVPWSVSEELWQTKFNSFENSDEIMDTKTVDPPAGSDVR